LGLVVPFPELALEVVHVEIVGELVQVRELCNCYRLCYTLGTRIKRAVHVGAQGKQAFMYTTRCLDSIGTALSAAPDSVAWT
jgi:hypothetical protein